MKRYILRIATSILCLTACLTSAYAQKPNTYTPIPLVAMFQDAGNVNCDGTVNPTCADRIRSDGGGAYTNGIQGVAASFDQYGNLIIDFQTGKTPQRFVYFDFGSPYEAYGSTPPSSANQGDAYLATLSISNTPYTALQNMTLGQEQCLRLGITFTLGSTQWRANFHRNQYTGSQDFSRTAYGVISCVGADGEGCIKWELEPKATESCASGLPNVAEVVDVLLKGNGTTLHGVYNMPFKLTLYRK